MRQRIAASRCNRQLGKPNLSIYLQCFVRKTSTTIMPQTSTVMGSFMRFWWLSGVLIGSLVPHLHPELTLQHLIWRLIKS